MVHTDGRPGPPSWTLLTGPLDPENTLALLTGLADRHGLHLARADGDAVHLAQNSGEPVVSVSWRPAPPGPASTLGHQVPAQPRTQVLLTRDPGADAAATSSFTAALEAALLPYSQAELDTITASMPLVRHFSTPDPALDGWALIFRDHYLEHSVGFVLGLHRSGIPAAWIFTLAKGDHIRNRHRIDATFRSLGFRSAVLDNAAINDPDAHRGALTPVLAELDAFIDAAHAAGRRVLVVDDGGLLASGYGAAAAPRQVDAAIELTVSGLKRITAAGPLAVPVLNLARSTVKTLLGYPEIADSCLRRLRALIPAHKVIGRPVTLLGYGTLGSRLAHGLRSLGARVSIVDTDIRALVTAAEAGYPTRRTLAEAITADPPFLLAATTGEIALSPTDLPLLPDGLLLAPFATRDFSLLVDGDLAEQAAQIPGLGVRYRLSGDRHVTLLGDGRSLNLFEADSIPNQGYDAYRAGTLVAAKALCARPDAFPVGVHVAPADEAIAARPPPPGPHRRQRPVPACHHAAGPDLPRCPDRTRPADHARVRDLHQGPHPRHRPRPVRRPHLRRPRLRVAAHARRTPRRDPRGGLPGLPGRQPQRRRPVGHLRPPALRPRPHRTHLPTPRERQPPAPRTRLVHPRPAHPARPRSRHHARPLATRAPPGRRPPPAPGPARRTNPLHPAPGPRHRPRRLATRPQPPPAHRRTRRPAPARGHPHRLTPAHLGPPGRRGPAGRRTATRTRPRAAAAHRGHGRPPTRLATTSIQDGHHSRGSREPVTCTC